MKKSVNINSEYSKYIKNFTEYNRSDKNASESEDYSKTKRFDERIRK